MSVKFAPGNLPNNGERTKLEEIFSYPAGFRKAISDFITEFNAAATDAAKKEEVLNKLFDYLTIPFGNLLDEFDKELKARLDKPVDGIVALITDLQKTVYGVPAVLPTAGTTKGLVELLREAIAGNKAIAQEIGPATAGRPSLGRVTAIEDEIWRATTGLLARITALELAVANLRNDLTAETTDRKSEDIKLKNDITAETNARQLADTDLGARITKTNNHVLSQWGVLIAGVLVGLAIIVGAVYVAHLWRPIQPAETIIKFNEELVEENSTRNAQNKALILENTDLRNTNIELERRVSDLEERPRKTNVGSLNASSDQTDATIEKEVEGLKEIAASQGTQISDLKESRDESFRWFKKVSAGFKDHREQIIAAKKLYNSNREPASVPQIVEEPPDK